MLYCPKCLNQSLTICARGVAHVIINGRKLDNGRFLFNMAKIDMEETTKEISQKLEDFFKWYSTFKNQDPIGDVKICSSDFTCDNGCKLNIDTKYSTIDILIPRKKLLKILTQLGEKYNMVIDIDEEDLS